jgi:hypothetical protein
MANNDANADKMGLIVNVKYDTNVPPHVIAIPSPRVIIQQAVVVVDNRPPMGSPHNSPKRIARPIPRRCERHKVRAIQHTMRMM